MEGLGSECSFYDFLLNKSLQAHSLRNLHGAVSQNDNLPLHLNIKAAEVRNEIGNDMNPLEIIASKKIQVIVLPSADRVMRQATHPQKIDWRAFAQEKDFKQVVEQSKKEQYADDCVVTSQGSKTDRKSTSYQRQQEKLQNQKKIWTTENKLKFVMAEKIGFGEVQKMHRRFLTQKMKSSFVQERAQRGYISRANSDEDFTPQKSEQESFPEEQKSLTSRELSEKITPKPGSTILDNKTIEEKEETSSNHSASQNLFDTNIFFSQKELELQQKWEENNPSALPQQLRVISEGQEKVLIDAVCKQEKFQLVDLFPSERMQHEIRRVPLKDVELSDFDRQKFDLNKQIEEKRKKDEEKKQKPLSRFKQKIVRDENVLLHQGDSIQNISNISQIREVGSNEIANHPLEIPQITPQPINLAQENSKISKIVSEQQLKQLRLRKRRQENATSLKRLMKDSEANSLLFLREKCIGSMDINLHSTFQQISGRSRMQEQSFGRSKSGDLLKSKEEMSAYSKIIQTERQSLKAAIEQLEAFKHTQTAKNQIQDSKSTRNNYSELSLPVVGQTRLFGKKNSSISNLTDRPCISLSKLSKRNCSPFLRSSSNLNSSQQSTPLCSSRVESSMSTPLKSLKSLECKTERSKEINRFQKQKEQSKKPQLKIDISRINQAAYIDCKRTERLRDTQSVSKLDSDTQIILEKINLGQTNTTQDKIMQSIREPQVRPVDNKLKNFKDSLRIKECFYDFYGKCVKSQKKATTDSEKMEKKIVREVKKIDKCLERLQNKDGRDISNFQEEFKNFKEIKIFKRRLFNFVVNAVQPEDRKQIFEKYSMTHRREIEEAFSHQLQR